LCQTYPPATGNNCDQTWFDGLTDQQLVDSQNGFLGSPSQPGSKYTWEDILVAEQVVGLRGLPWAPVNDSKQPSTTGSLICGQPYTSYYGGGTGCFGLPANVTPVTAAKNGT